MNCAEQFQQGMLVQAGLVDMLVGRLRARLATAGLYDRAIVVITADHGISFKPGTWARPFTDRGLPGIVPVPLIVKLPADRLLRAPGAIDDRNVETIDVLPTIADALGVAPPQGIDGVSALAGGPRRASKRIYFKDASTMTSFDPAEIARLRDAEAARTIATFGSGPWPAPKLPAIDGLIGRSLSSLTITASAAAPRVQIDNTQSMDFVDPAASALPVQAEGRVLGADRQALDSLFLAVALNGTIVATTRTWSEKGTWLALLPLERLRRGRNDLEVFVVDPARPTHLLTTRISRRLPDALDLLAPEPPDYGVARQGFYRAEAAGATRFHWTRNDASLTVPLVEGFAPTALEVDVLFSGRPGKRLRIMLDGCEVVSEALPGGHWTRTIPLGACTPHGRWTTLRFLSDTHRPERDRRRVGVALARVALRQ